MKKSRRDENKQSRRDFLRKGMEGMLAFGAGGAAGVFADDTIRPKPGNHSAIPNASPTSGYDMSKLAEVDPALIRYREKGRFGCDMEESVALWIDNGDLVYVCGDECVNVFDRVGRKRTTLKVGGRPRAVCSVDGDRILVAVGDRIVILDSEGGVLSDTGSLGERSVVTSIAVGGEGTIFAADAGEKCIWKISADGKVLSKNRGDTEGGGVGFVIPSPFFDIAFDADGLLWATNTGEHRIEAYNEEGEISRSWGKPTMAIEGFCGCCNPVNISILNDGRFVTAEKGLPRVKVYSADGEFECVVAPPNSFPGLMRKRPAGRMRALDVAVNSDGEVYVLDTGSSQVRIFVTD
ncbi:MAG: NHL repeat-containing protein [Verrucomicrobia bacterium]|nr:NHL repeat-containing protein [Verrucomicrobiota bacterium]